MAADARPQFVTPEAVVLEFETAGIGSRGLAKLLDVLIQTALLVAGTFASVLIGASGLPELAGTVVLVLFLGFVLVGYPVIFETLWRGRTPGKAALGLRVACRDGSPVRFRHAAVRGFLLLVDLYTLYGGIAVVSMLLTRDNQRLGDLVAGTVVLRERSGSRPPTAVAFSPPPGLEGYAAELDTAGLGPDDYGAVRSFLLRASALQPEVRQSLAEQVATTVAGRLGHRPPPGVWPEAYLACVAAASQQRAAALAARPAGDGSGPGALAASSVWSQASVAASRPSAGPPSAPAPAPVPSVAQPSGDGFSPPA